MGLIKVALVRIGEEFDVFTDYGRAGTATLYVIVDQGRIEKKKIKAEIVKIPRSPKVKADISPSTFISNISQIVPFVNSKDLL